VGQPVAGADVGDGTAGGGLLHSRDHRYGVLV